MAELAVVTGASSGIGEAYAELLAQPAREEVLRRAFRVPALRCRIVPAQCGDDAGLFGAAWLAFQNLAQ